MQGQSPQPPATLRDILPADPFGGPEKPRVPVYGSLRLEPVVLGPPPEPGTSSVTAADDIDLTELSDRPRSGLIAGLMAVLAVGATIGAAWWTLRPQQYEIATPPSEIQPVQPPPVAEAAPPPVAAGAPQPAADSQSVDMVRIDGDLVPPSTDGLSPARRIPTVRILVENDREVVAPR